MQFLYEQLQTLQKFGHDVEIPDFLLNNLSTNIKLRDYQKNAIKNTLIYLNSNISKNKQTHLLYHMATGSGKTVIMALNIIYYYSLGYRNFLFFTNQTNIISKTKINFLQKTSSKYLFSKNISIAGKNVEIKEVSNFSESTENSINIAFNTVQGIHSLLNVQRENSLTIEDFENEKVVLIADEAHHLNSTTSKDKEEIKINSTWEDTVYKILLANKDNVLLEFTATCDVQDVKVKNKYLDKIVFNFDLKEFRNAGYTKEFINIQSNASKWTKTLQAILLSQYRKLVFEFHKISVKPVVLLKSKTILDSKSFYVEFYSKLKTLSSKDLLEIKNDNLKNMFFVNAFNFFETLNLSLDDLVELIKIDFCENNSINMNELNKENEDIVNNLDEKTNHHRLIFTVDKLTEGWDVLSLFDIVRLFDTRQGGVKGMVSKYTLSEAQLIGRGARYLPFKFDEQQNPDKRKYSDYLNPLSICETLAYYCVSDSKYIDEIKKALRETGLLPEKNSIQVKYTLKNSFKKTKTYNEGYIFLNKRKEISRDEVKSLPEVIRTSGISFKCSSNVSIYKYLIIDEPDNKEILTDFHQIKFKDIKYTIIYKAFRSFWPEFSFSSIKKQFPHLKSIYEFLTSINYVGDFPITFITEEGKKPTVEDKRLAAKKVLEKIFNYIRDLKITFKGTSEFFPYRVKDLFTDRIRNITKNIKEDYWGEGISQKDESVDLKYRLDLSNSDWYAYNDNYGTSEEKKFIKYFSTLIEELKLVFSNIFLIRNELQIAIYSFNEGWKFQPDYILILEKENNNINKKNLYICMFIEPKGRHLLEQDNWKNKLMYEIKKLGTPIATIVDDAEYKIWGTPLYNEEVTKEEFKKYFNSIITKYK
ncbi:DEAD/DEAH box helicase [Mycoplasma hyorhinis]|uniref:DEAD/DEAH box helicase family protein n=1 Tax=Mesomycoplasma hyorhinis TaxID=2100 RepID=UPI00136AD4E8|nr:DEAD/DEAH box helicase family protein [Mesomycoplasma hyorhinis]MXR07580.1 DEAD/DEAH box helicase [Mesomycoplasma hyorhinis]